MGRLKIVGERKALNIPLSLRPKHKLMLDELEKIFCLNRSKIVQKLIEEAYIARHSEVLKQQEEEQIHGAGS
jgi:hypothetical protein